MELSKRLQAVADMVTKGEVVADIGTDHGYIPIYLVQAQICSTAIAMDINEGPYMRAKQHIAGYGLANQIQTRLSNGMNALEQGEVTTVIIAGMGGGLVMKILEQDRRLWEGLQELILQPQSEIDKVRTYLAKNSWDISEEEMVLDDGKYYTIMKATRGKVEPYTQKELLYGRKLIQKKNSVLLQFLNREIELKETVIESLRDKSGEHIKVRILELQKELEVAYAVQRHITAD